MRSGRNLLPLLIDSEKGVSSLTSHCSQRFGKLTQVEVHLIRLVTLAT